MTHPKPACSTVDQTVSDPDTTSNEQESADLPSMDEPLAVPWKYLVKLGHMTLEVGLLSADFPAVVTTNG
jgi:hypothetical protein